MMKKKLKDVCDFYSGTGFPTQYQGDIEGDYPFYKVSDIANNATAGKVYLELCNNYISMDVAKKIKGCILPKDTVVFAKIGEALKLNRRAITSCNCLIDNNAMGIAPRLDLLSIMYFYFFMKNLNMQMFAESTTVPSVRKTVLEDYEIEVPTLNEQKKIERKLVLLQEIVERRKQELSALDYLIKARFVEMFGDPATNPMRWDETTIGDECFYIKDGPHKSLTDIGKENGGHPFISVRNMVNGNIDFSTARYISNEDYADAIKKCHPEKGDMLYSKGGTTGIAKLIDIDEEFANWVHVAVLKFNKSRLNGVFFENMLNCAYCYEQSQRLTKGIANRDLVLSAMAQIKMYCPPIELQEQFADFVKQIDKSKVKVQKSLDETQCLFDSLMKKYFG